MHRDDESREPRFVGVGVCPLVASPAQPDQNRHSMTAFPPPLPMMGLRPGHAAPGTLSTEPFTAKLPVLGGYLAHGIACTPVT